MSFEGGLNSTMRRLRIKTTDDEERCFVLKSTRVTALDQSKNLGLAREALFFNELGDNFKSSLPKVYFSHGNMSTGEKYIIFEDLSDAVQTGYFFGPGSPLNWGKDLIAEQKSLSHVTMRTIAEEAIKLAARIHGTYWKKADLLVDGRAWLRGAEWLQGAGRAAWQGGQAYAKHLWEKTKSEKMPAEGYGVRWNPDVVALLDESMQRINWEAFQDRIQEDPWTLVHGDYHPANMLWRATSPKPADNSADAEARASSLVLLDWEVVGLGSGAQDVGQYVISHMSPPTRRECEEPLMRLYYSQLVSYGTVSTEEYPWEKCWGEYVAGGTERWVWLLALLSQMCPDPMVQYFHDQVEAFVQDHNVTAATVGMPRL